MDFKSRKLIAVSVLFVTATTFLYTGTLSPADWVEFNKWIFAAYVTGNVGEHYTKRLDK